MNMLDMISEPLLFAQQSYEHAKKVHESVRLVQLLVEALLSHNYQTIKTVRDEMSRIRDETAPIKLSLYDQIRDMHFRSPGGYAFSQYLACQDKVADSSQDFADLLVLRETTIPVDLQSDFRAFAAQIADVCERAMTPAEVLSSEAEAVPAETDVEKALDALRGITDSNRQAKRLGMKLVQRLHDHEEQLGLATTLFFDRCCAALQQAADAAERTGDHLRLIFPQA